VQTEILSIPISKTLTHSALPWRSSAKICEIWSSIQTCIGLADGVHSRLDLLLNTLNEIKVDFESMDRTVGMERTVREDAEEFAGVAIPEDIAVRPLSIAKNKGSGRGGRIKGDKERAIKEQQKGKRK